MLGDFRLIDEADGRDHSPRSRKACALLAHLALEPDRRASRDRLVGLLWSDRGEVQARASLRQALTDLRTHPAPRSSKSNGATFVWQRAAFPAIWARYSPAPPPTILPSWPASSTARAARYWTGWRGWIAASTTG
ncbi:hypothetical protein ACFSUK_25205 [Sphingobium scionense]